MVGKHHIVVQNRRVRFEFDVRRNITIVRGDSATGKTTLMSLVEAYDRLGDDSGVQVMCDKRCLTVNNADWELVIAQTHDAIVFLDEDTRAMTTTDFARALRESDNYYVIITREDLPNLPYSVDEVYGIRTSGKYADLRRTYNLFYRLYEPGQTDEPEHVGIEDVLVEDSNSGFEFYRAVAREGICVTSARGKSNVRQLLPACVGKGMLVIADGAAFGPEMGALHLYVRSHPEVHVYLPESFEWLVLASGVVDGKRVREILDHPEDFVDSERCFSWERFFTDLLVRETEGTRLQYSKSQLNPAYLGSKTRSAVLDAMGPVRALIA